jgi:DNA-binding transcriptional LysR family regulator
LSKSLKLVQVQSFCGVVKSGSLAAAARAGIGTQATLSRHISELEETLGVKLFERRKEGLSLTKTGAYLFEYAEKVDVASKRFEVAALGQQQEISGTIRVAASTGVAAFLLPDILAKLGAEEPGVDVELVASDDSANLLMREADIAVRMFKPTQLNLVSRKIGELAFGAYASRAYLGRQGSPDTLNQLLGYDLIGEDRHDLLQRGLQSIGLKVTRESFKYRCDERTIGWNLVLAGCGIGITHCRHGDCEPQVVRVLADDLELKLPVWLTAHSELKTNACVRRVYDALADGLQAALAAPDA